MMHVLCEEYETVYAACFLVTSAVLGVDYGYQVTDQEQLAYVVQIEPEAIESLKAGHPIEVGLPPDSERIQVFRVQIGKDELSKVVPATYQKPVKEIDPEVKLFPANNAILTAPPDSEVAADTKPSLGAEVADYGPRSTRELPYGATSSSGTGTAGSTTGGTGNSTSAYGEIPGAAARYGGGTSSNFSVPSPPGSPSTYGAAQTSATAPVTGSTNGTTGNGASPTGSNPGSQYGSSSSIGATGSPATGGTTASENRYSNWNTSPSATGTTAGTNTNTGNPASSTATGATGGTAADRFRYGEQQPSTSAGSNIVQPSSPSTGGWRNEVSTDLGGSPASNYSNPGSQNPSGTQNNYPSSNNTAPPLMTGGSSYPNQNNNNQPPQTGAPTNNGTSGQNNEWLTWNNGLGGTSQPTSNQTPPPQYPQNPNPPNYNNQPQQGYPNGGNFNNGTVNNVPYQQGQGQYGNPGGYNPNLTASYNQPPYPNANENSQIAYLAALARLSGMQPQNGASNITSTNNTVPPRGNDAEEEEKSSKTPPTDKEIVREPPDWWQLLAVGFLISICLNGYMFMTSQDFRRKYQDLLEDVRDLRSLSND